MKWNKLLGISLIASSLFLQVGYATTYNPVITNPTQYDIYFKDAAISCESAYVKATIAESTKGEAALELQVENIYPGEKFTFTATIENLRGRDVKIADVQLAVLDEKSKGYNVALMDMLVGYDEAERMYKGPDKYRDYLVYTYKNRILKAGQGTLGGESFPVSFMMGMDTGETGRMNERVAFKIIFVFEDVVDEPNEERPPVPPTETMPDEPLVDDLIPGGGSTHPDVSEGETSLPTDPLEDGDEAFIIIDDDPIPGGSIGQIEQEQPEEIDPIVLTEQITREEQEEIEEVIEDDEVPKGGMLPQTGGIAPQLVYGLGVMLLTGGIALYTRKEKQ